MSTVAPEIPGRPVAGAGDLVLAVEGPQALHEHAALRESARLVGADDRDGTERLDRGQPANERVVADHALRPEGEPDRHHGRQRLGDGRHGEAHGGEEHQLGVLATRHAGHEHHDADGDGGHRQPAPEHGEPLLQRRMGRLVLLEQTGDLAERRLHARGDHDAARPAVHDRGALEHHVAPVTDHLTGVFGERVRVLVRRYRLAGECRLVDPEVGALDETGIGRDDVAGLQHEHIARYEVGGDDGGLGAVTHDPRRGGRHGAQRRHRLFGAVLLEEPDEGIEDDDGADDDGVRGLADRHHHCRRDEQHHDHRVGELRDEDPPRRLNRLLLELVGPVTFPALPHLGRPQATLGIGVQCGGHRGRIGHPPLPGFDRGRGRHQHLPELGWWSSLLPDSKRPSEQCLPHARGVVVAGRWRGRKKPPQAGPNAPASSPKGEPSNTAQAGPTDPPAPPKDEPLDPSCSIVAA